jgi:hypothetical protein
MIAVGAQATPGPSTRAPHARVLTRTHAGTGSAAQDDRPYDLSQLAHAAVLEAPQFAGRPVLGSP